MPEREKNIPVTTFLSKTSTQLVILMLLTGLTFFTNLSAVEPTLMESRNFITAREMTQQQNWLLPTMNGELRLAKPPLPTWLTALAGLSAGDMGNLAVLRFPAAAISVLAVLMLFMLARLLTHDPLVPFLAAAILTTSYLFVHLGRQATWDVYCHSFMLGAIWQFVKGCRKEGLSYGNFALCGVFLGLSFMSKGPVSFYALLLPFLFSYGYGYGLQAFKDKRKGILLVLLVFVVIASAWPFYVYLREPENFALMMTQESDAWMTRHVKPLWFYVTFPAETGMWTLLTFLALLAPYARPRVQPYGNYRFLAVWVLASVVLLSIIPEKKERYLLPVVIPMALLTAHYLKFLLDYCKTGKGTKWDYRVLLANGIITSVALFAAPFLLYFFAYKTHALSAAELVLASLFFLVAGLGLLWMIRKKAFYPYFLIIIGLHVGLLLLFIPLYKSVTSLNEEHSSHHYIERQAVRICFIRKGMISGYF